MLFSGWTIQQAKRDYSFGRFQNFRILKVMQYYTVILYQIGDISGSLLDSRGQQSKYFKSLDSVINTLQDIGFDCGVLVPGPKE